MSTEGRLRNPAKKDDRERVFELKEQLDNLEKTVKELALHNMKQVYAMIKERGNGASDSGNPAGEAMGLFDDACSSSATLSEEDKLRRLLQELQQDVGRKKINLPLLKAKLDKARELWNGVMLEEMRAALEDHLRRTGSTYNAAAVREAEPEECDDVWEKKMIEDMDGDAIPDISLAEYMKKPEQPKGISRNVWMEHLRMAKKFADVISDMCDVHRSGNTENLDGPTTKSALASAGKWVEKWRNNESMMKIIHPIVAYEVICRVKDFEYYYCNFCNVVCFNVKQFLAHFSGGKHGKGALNMWSSEDVKRKLFGYVDRQVTILTVVCNQLHTFFTQQFTTPLVKSGEVPAPSNNSIPTLDFLKEMEKKYGKAINGDLDETKFKDTAYVASKLAEIIQRHKSKIGKKLFKELDAYLEKGTSIYCGQCMWKVSNCKSFYRHILNPYHISVSHREEGHHFNLLTVSINVHLRGEIC